MKSLLDFEEIDCVSNTNQRLLELPIGTRFTVKNDKYKDVYEVVDFPYLKPRRQYDPSLSWTLNYGGNDPYWRKCTECAWHWRVGFCSDIREPGLSFCENAEHYGARTDGKRVIFKVVK